jgi:thiamine-monophosphate kinase
MTGALTEEELIRRYFAERGGARVQPRPDVLTGIGDDGAVTRAPAGRDLVTVADMIVAGSHFPTGTPPDAIGHRALAVNLSDLAAMAAEPLWCTLCLSLPAADPGWIGAFADGFFALADRTGIALVGGDTVRGPLAASVTAIGAVAPGMAVFRSGAAAGDDVWVSGTPGDAVAGRLLLGEDAAVSPRGARRAGCRSRRRWRRCIPGRRWPSRSPAAMTTSSASRRRPGAGTSSTVTRRRAACR